MTDVPFRFAVATLAPEDGGGYLAYALDMPGCMSDGETIEEATINLVDAAECWLAAVHTNEAATLELRAMA